MNILTSDPAAIKPFVKDIWLPKPDSHKGQNGRVLIIGGSELFHAASLWAAEMAAHFVDIVHFSSTSNNLDIYKAAKHTFHNGIVIQREDIPGYILEDDAVLIGPGMVRCDKKDVKDMPSLSFQEILELKNEAVFTYALTKYLIHTYTDNRMVFDAGALQMMAPQWLLELKQKPIITPHQLEFERIFNISIHGMSVTEKMKVVAETAARFHIVILLKAVVDIVSDGIRTVVIEGGNAGLTKGGSGDTLAGLTLALYAKNDPFTSAVLASYLVKKAADELYATKGYWYNMYDLISKIPNQLKIIAL